MLKFNTSPSCLDDRRPRFLHDLVGNDPVKLRLAQQMRNGSIPQLTFIYGPSGSGKTTLAYILARYFFCKGRRGGGDPCGHCEACAKEVEDHYNFEEWAGADLEREWDAWSKNHKFQLRKKEYFYFPDEAQDLDKLHQKSFLKLLEKATATVVMATTHLNAIVDTLVNRFETNVYEMRRPTVMQVVDYIDPLSVALNLQCSRDQLQRVAEHFACDLRKCVDFPYTAVRQLATPVVTDEYLTAVLGVQPTVCDTAKTTRKRRVKL